MKQLLIGYFLPNNYEKMLYLQYKHCAQGSKYVSAYTEEFYRFSVCNNLVKNDSQLVARHIGGLKDSRQDKFQLHDT